MEEVLYNKRRFVMWWAIILLIVAAIFVFGSGASDDKSDRIGTIIVGALLGVVGSVMLYYSGFGNPCVPGEMAVEPIYAVAGRVETSRGPVFVIEDAQMNVFCVWGQLTDDQPSVPDGTKLVKITTEKPMFNRHIEAVNRE